MSMPCCDSPKESHSATPCNSKSACTDLHLFHLRKAQVYVWVKVEVWKTCKVHQHAPMCPCKISMSHKNILQISSDLSGWCRKIHHHVTACNNSLRTLLDHFILRNIECTLGRKGERVTTEAWKGDAAECCTRLMYLHQSVCNAAWWSDSLVAAAEHEPSRFSINHSLSQFITVCREETEETHSFAKICRECPPRLMPGWRSGHP